MTDTETAEQHLRERLREAMAELERTKTALIAIEAAVYPSVGTVPRKPVEVVAKVIELVHTKEIPWT